jgi:hypothetical protein
MFRLGLVLEKSTAVIHRLNPAATKDLRPYPGVPAGYDKDFREPLVFDGGPASDEKERLDTRMELPPVRVPCQIETPKFEELLQEVQGNDPKTTFHIVLWRRDLEDLGLIDTKSRACLIKVDDRVSCIEKWNEPGVVTVPFSPPGMYITEVQPGSPGFGPDGYDLEICFLSRRRKGGS